MKNIYFILLAVIIFLFACTAKNDSKVIADLYNIAMNDTSMYHNLRILSNEYPNRLCGTPESLMAIEFMKSAMLKERFDTVYLQECIVAKWDRGGKEIGRIESQMFGATNLLVCTFGNSVGTNKDGITAEVVEVKSFEDLDSIGAMAINGKIVFFNKPMDSTKIATFEAYGEVVGFRFAGASVAARYGAVAVLVRSVTTAIDTFPHTGVTRYEETPKQIPAFSISTFHADILSKQLTDDSKLKVYLSSNCKYLDNEKSYNVIGEVRGSEFPNEIITVGGHIDTWDNTSGAHDDGTGCVQSIGVWHIFNELRYKPKRTLRVVLFMDEEMNQRGGKQYALNAALNNEQHIFALESDGGCDKPLGFSFETIENQLAKLQSFRNLFEPYGINIFVNAGGGVDVGFLKNLCPIIGELVVNPTHYFDYHHCGNDTFEHINNKYLQEGSASMTALIYLVDKYGIVD